MNNLVCSMSNASFGMEILRRVIVGTSDSNMYGLMVNQTDDRLF